MIKKIYKTKIKDLKVFTLKRFSDERGFFQEIFNKSELKKKLDINFNNMQTSLSFSKKNVIRGFHFQKNKPISQIVYVIKGKIIDIVVDIRKSSKTFGKYEIFNLSEANKKIIYMPKGFAHGFYSLEKENILIYHQSQKYLGKFDSGFHWKYKNIQKKIKIKKPIISKKDNNLPKFNEKKF